MPAEIRSFFERYREAFNALDGEAVAALYAVPCGIASDAGYTHWPTLEPVRKNMVALCELYRKNGYISAEFEPAAFIAQGPTLAVADLSWGITWEREEPWRFNTTYNLICAPEGWRVLLATAYSEKRLDGRADKR
ncbi:MAG: hypothetical protein ABI330_08150 [Caldimonas sp.]